MRDGSKAPKGKLYAKYHNVIRSLKSGGLIEKTKNTVKPPYNEIAWELGPNIFPL